MWMSITAALVWNCYISWRGKILDVFWIYPPCPSLVFSSLNPSILPLSPAESCHCLAWPAIPQSLCSLPPAYQLFISVLVSSPRQSPLHSFPLVWTHASKSSKRRLHLKDEQKVININVCFTLVWWKTAALQTAEMLSAVHILLTRPTIIGFRGKWLKVEE